MNKGQNKQKRYFKREDMKVNQILISLSILVSQVSVLPARTITPDLLGEQGLEKVAMAVEATSSTHGKEGSATLLQQMEWLHQTKKVNFVYDSSLKVDIPYTGPDIKKMSVKKALKALFEKTEFDYTINANYVILKRRPKQQISTSHTNMNHNVQHVQRRHTLSGYVRDESGESLINATVYDLTHGIGTTTNEYGFFSLTLPEGEHQLRFSYVGYADKVEKLKLEKDMHYNMALHVDGKLPEVMVNGDLNSPLLTTQTGKRSFAAKDIKTEFSLMSSPDVVKTLQRVSGVAEGQELASGLYVHGGNGDENLFLIDGTPLYQINHAIGLFSSFNVDVVKNIDFYKSGFPARYGGRLSSVVDVRTADGDMNHFHGAYRIGLLDASVQLEGPIVKGKTSYNIGLRRSWADLLTRPLSNWLSDKDDKICIGYYFMDLNAKVTHRFSDRSKIYLSLYHGNDSWNVKDVMDDSKVDGFQEGQSYYYDKTHSKLAWGNFNVALNWNYLFSPKLFANFTAVYTHNRSKLYSLEDERYVNPTTKKDSQIYHLEHRYHSTIDDLGYRTEFDYRPNAFHHIRFGHDFTMHQFRPQTYMQLNYVGQTADKVDTTSVNGRNHHQSYELSAYAEDEIILNPRWNVNVGFNMGLFHVGSKSFFNIDPRLALKYQLSQEVSLKASFTQMTQYVHKISNSYLDLPTDYWVPTTERLKPMRSYQLAAGVYAQPNRHWTLSLEGYYKLSRHLLQYTSWVGVEPPADKWEELVMDGKGLFYGLEADATYRTDHLTLSGSYTLSWNKRKYEDFYPDWYYDKFDNRHKLNLSLRYAFNKKVSCFAVWYYHTGNHATVPTQMASLPQLPDAEGHLYSGWAGSYDYVYAIPNNLTLPAYHRLDLGFDFRHVTKHGHERIWNLSIYNAYCHLNSMYVKIDYDEEKQQFKAKNKAFIPILPSFSYTIKF